MTQTVGKVGKWEIKRRARRLEILEVAQKLLVNNGLDALSMHLLAKTLSCTPGALYRYFKSRDEILMTLQVQNIEWLRSAFDHGRNLCIQDAELEPGGEAILAILASSVMYGSLPEVLPQRFNLITLIAGSTQHVVDDQTGMPAVLATLGMLSDVACYINDAIEEGALSPGQSIRRTTALWTSIHGAAITSKLARFPNMAPQFDGLIEEIAADLLAAWGASPPLLATCRDILSTHGKTKLLTNALEALASNDTPSK